MESKAQIKAFIMSELVSDKAQGDISDSDSLIESGIVDSLGIMKLMSFLEESLSVSLGPEELTPDNFSSIDAIEAMVQRKKG